MMMIMMIIMIIRHQQQAAHRERNNKNKVVAATTTLSAIHESAVYTSLRQAPHRRSFATVEPNVDRYRTQCTCVWSPQH
jgi:hypothetical protein